MEAAQPTTLEPSVEQPLDPLFAIWTQPRTTIHRVVDRPVLQVLLLAIVGGVYMGLSRAAGRGMGDLHPADPFLAVLLVVVFSALLSIPLLYLLARVLRWTGGLLHGQADDNEIRAAIAWSNVPLLAGLALLALQLPIFGEDLFLSSKPRIEADRALQIALLGFGVLRLVLQVWGVVIFVMALAEVQRFAVWQAIVNMVLTAVALFVPLLLLYGVVQSFS